MPEQRERFIVAEISKNWDAAEFQANMPPSQFICKQFEHVLAVNWQRGYRLLSFSLHRLMTSETMMNETIVAAFELVAGDAAKPNMKPFEEIQRAHDILHAQITGATPFVFDEVAQPCVLAALDALCWVLNHDHSDGFRRSLQTIEEALAQQGYVIRRADRPFRPFVGRPPE